MLLKREIKTSFLINFLIPSEEIISGAANNLDRKVLFGGSGDGGVVLVFYYFLFLYNIPKTAFLLCFEFTPFQLVLFHLYDPFYKFSLFQ